MKLLAVLVIVMCPIGTMCQFNMTAYRAMPPLFKLDDYDACLENPKPSSYCVVIAEIVPNTSLALWNQIASFSAVTKRHYRHDHLYFGVCTNLCKQLVDPLSPYEKAELYTGKIENTELTEFFEDINKRDYDPRLLNDKVINTCLNYNSKQQYGLQVRTYNQYCVSNNEPSNFDYWEIAFMITVGTLVFLVILSSQYDRQLRQKQEPLMQGREFYQEKLHIKRDALLASFSLCRNYYRLNMLPTSDLGRDLQFFDGLRFMLTCLVVTSHLMLYLKSIPIQNSEFVEKLFYRIETNILVSGTAVIQIFLVMSSFLLYTIFQRTMISKNPGLVQWGQIISNRYLRIAPSLAFAILVNASILPRLQDGPFWRHITEAETILCRETGWRNMLLINNFLYKKSCIHQTWYIAADFQLYIILTAVLIIIARFPKTRNYFLGAGVILSLLTTGMITYFLKLNGTHQETPGSYLYFFWFDGETIFQGYVQFYVNFGGVTFGSIAALFYLKYKNEGLNLKANKSKLSALFWFGLLLPFLSVLSGEILYRYEFKRPSIWLGIYAGLQRSLIALMCGFLILLMALQVKTAFYRFCSMNMFVPLGRISFQAYLIHSVIIRCLLGGIRQPVYANRLHQLMYAVTSMVMSYIVAFLLYLFLELPVANVINLAMKGSDKPSEPIKSCQLTTTTNNQVTTTA